MALKAEVRVTHSKDEVRIDIDQFTETTVFLNMPDARELTAALMRATGHR